MNPDSDNHLGSSTFLTDAAGEPYQFVMYLPFGETFTEQRAAGFGTPYLFNAKELDEETGLYYYGARYYDARISTWWGVDPLADAPLNIGTSPYAYVWNNPMKFIDPTGLHGQTTIVGDKEDGTFIVKEWIDDGSIDIVLENGTKIGETLTTHSFVGDNGKAVVGTIINPSDNSGQDFIDDEIVGANPGLFHYIKNATGGEKYDFKHRGSDDRPEGMTEGQHHYRGGTFNGKIASARDIGNYAAGYVAGENGIGWGAARLAFDALESYQQGGFATEGKPTQQAQKAGHNAGYLIHKQRIFERELQKMKNPWPTGPKY